MKECNFFGPKSEYVISGSDCRHVFIWRKSDGKIVNILKGDSRITNVVQGNPTNCSLVTSGLDNTVKLFTPTATASYKENEMEKRQQRWQDIMDENERDSERSRHPIPMSLLVYLLQRGLYGPDISDDDEDEDDQKLNHDDDDDDADNDEEEDIDDDDDDNDNGQDDEDALLSFLE